ncbi:MAG: hypothetical protein WCO26_21565, partial [Deltaproteobacteria bacterium]
DISIYGQDCNHLPHMGGDKNCRAVYEDVPGFCKAGTLDEIRNHGHVLTPGRYVGAEVVEDDGEPFEQKMKRLMADLRIQMPKSKKKLAEEISKNLGRLGIGD